jgi:hypothetical protein
VNEMLENIGGLVDVEDLVEDEEGSADGDGGSGAGNDQSDTRRERADMAAKKMFVTSRPGMDGGGLGGNSTARQTKQSSASLAEKLLHGLSHDTEGQNDAVIRLYLQQIRGHEETIRMQDMQIDSLCQELAQAVQQIHALETDKKVLKVLRAHCGHSSRHHHHEHSLSLSSDSDASGSTSSSQYSRTPSQVILQRKHHCGLPASLTRKTEKGKEKMIYEDKEDEK